MSNNIQYRLINENICFKLTSVFSNSGITSKQYNNNYNYNVYLYYKDSTNESCFIQNDLFSDNYIGILTNNELYIALSNIYVIEYSSTTIINQLKNIYYGNINKRFKVRNN